MIKNKVMQVSTNPQQTELFSCLMPHYGSRLISNNCVCLLFTADREA